MALTLRGVGVGVFITEQTRQSKTFLQTLAGPVYIPSYDMLVSQRRSAGSSGVLRLTIFSFQFSTYISYAPPLL